MTETVEARMRRTREQPPQGFFWVDLEMSGLDADRHVILEAACVVTDPFGKELSSFAAVIHHGSLDESDFEPYSWQQHSGSGLIDACLSDGLSLGQVDEAMARTAEEFFPGVSAYLAGNSVYRDWTFIRRHMPRLFSMLHYRLLDVTSLKLIAQSSGIAPYPKAKNHRALDDIRESIGEMQHILREFSRGPQFGASSFTDRDK
ncbi:oligoribonuclease [Micromonospora humi]|uniref:Oligoribonuclease n=1 Tax=Micromonospora humi TaxID=745366 RepID=A0A1C5HRA4_9ACTN|nr:oligoribonuclease [Micromonospora humi]SCG48502.1 oligoribonuclease [Micromonospora humi]